MDETGRLGRVMDCSLHEWLRARNCFLVNSCLWWGLWGGVMLAVPAASKKGRPILIGEWQLPSRQRVSIHGCVDCEVARFSFTDDSFIHLYQVSTLRLVPSLFSCNSQNCYIYFLKNYLLFIFNYLCICVWVYACEFRFPRRPEKVSDLLKLELQGCCELPAMGAENRLVDFLGSKSSCALNCWVIFLVIRLLT